MSDDNEDEICTSDENDASSDDSSDSSSDDDSDGDGDDECDGGDELKGTGDIYAKLCDSSVPAAKVNVYHFGNETEYIKASSSYSSQPKISKVITRPSTLFFRPTTLYLIFYTLIASSNAPLFQTSVQERAPKSDSKKVLKDDVEKLLTQNSILSCITLNPVRRIGAHAYQVTSNFL